MNTNKFNILEKIITKLESNGFHHVYYTSDGNIVWPTLERKDWYLDKNGVDRYLDKMPGQIIEGCHFVENPKHRIFNNLIEETLKGTGYSFMVNGCSVPMAWGKQMLVRDADVQAFYADVPCN